LNRWPGWISQSGHVCACRSCAKAINAKIPSEKIAPGRRLALNGDKPALREI